MPIVRRGESSPRATIELALIVLLDAGPLGLLALRDHHGPGAECHRWLASLAVAGADIRVPDVSLYEVRRELIRRGARTKIGHLDAILGAWRRAEEFWALVRRAGLPTTPDGDLDGDAILAGVAATTGGAPDEVVIATTNVRQFGRFPGVVARAWRSIR
jgi:predicted nucleic acid-binding protein